VQKWNFKTREEMRREEETYKMNGKLLSMKIAAHMRGGGSFERIWLHSGVGAAFEKL
jgi:hypothetical protein